MEISEINAGSKISSVKDQSGTKVQNVILCKARQRAMVCSSLKWVGLGVWWDAEKNRNVQFYCCVDEHCSSCAVQSAVGAGTPEPVDDREDK